MLVGLGMMAGSNDKIWVQMAQLNATLASINLLPLLGILDGGRFAKILFASLEEREESLITFMASLFAVLVAAGMLLLGKSAIFFMWLVVWGIFHESTKDDPRAAYSRQAMSKSRTLVMFFLWGILLFGTYIPSLFLPSWLN